jgi:hypothetical protein
MTRYYVELSCHADTDDVEAAATDLMDALLDEPGLIDADVAATLTTGDITVGVGVDADTLQIALDRALIGIRSAVHRSGGATAGWAENLEPAGASINAVLPATQG